MAFALLNGSPVIQATVGIPRVGAWHADIRVDRGTELAGSVTLTIADGLTFVGTIHRSGLWLDTLSLRMVAGADGLGKTAKPRHYRQTSLRTVLSDLLATAGERLSATSDAATLALTFPFWTTIGQTCGRMISSLLSDERLADSVAWRTLPDGSLWVGPETWPDSGLADVVDYQILVEAPADGWLELGVEAPSLLPGYLLGGRMVSYVEHDIDGSSARTRVLVEV